MPTPKPESGLAKSAASLVIVVAALVIQPMTLASVAVLFFASVLRIGRGRPRAASSTTPFFQGQTG